MHLYLVSFSSPRTFKRSDIAKDFKLRIFFLNMAYLPADHGLFARQTPAASMLSPRVPWWHRGFEQSDHGLSQARLS